MADLPSMIAKGMAGAYTTGSGEKREVLQKAAGWMKGTSMIPSDSLASDRRWWHVNIADIRPKVLAILFVLGILQYWAIGLACCYLDISDTGSPDSGRFQFVSYFTHWASVGGLIGFAVSRNRRRGGLIGAVIGLVLSAVLMM